MTARIVILVREDEGLNTDSAVARLARQSWQPLGHEIVEQWGVENAPDADLAILHVDLTVVPEDYLALARRYPRCINIGATDISKRRVSRDLLAENDDYDGPVVVKTNLNHGGAPERRLAMKDAGLLARLAEAVERRLPGAWTGRLPRDQYLLLERRSQVPRWVWRRPELVVEKFFSEREGGLYVLHQWHFLGSGSLVLTLLAPNPLIKYLDHVARRPFHDDVPAEIRRRREELGFDFGKFDYIVTPAGPKLLDANRTPFMPQPGEEPRMRAMAAGLADFLG